MMQTTAPSHTMIVHFDWFEYNDSTKYVAWIEGPCYADMVVQADSLAECLSEISTTIKVTELYRKNINK